MIVECPHCYVKVIPSQEGICPSCRQNTRDLSGTDPSRGSLSIHEHERLPDLCFQCGVRTSQRVRVSRRRYDENDPAPTPLAAVLLNLFTLLGGYIFLGGTRQVMRVRILLPQCRSCARQQGPPDPRYVNYESHNMTFVVNKAFRNEVYLLRRGHELHGPR